MRLTHSQAIILLVAAVGLAALASVPTYDGCMANVSTIFRWIACPLGASAIATAIMSAAAILILSAVKVEAEE